MRPLAGVWRLVTVGAPWCRDEEQGPLERGMYGPRNCISNVGMCALVDGFRQSRTLCALRVVAYDAVVHHVRDMIYMTHHLRDAQRQRVRQGAGNDSDEVRVTWDEQA